jgi:hypothetical protein
VAREIGRRARRSPPTPTTRRSLLGCHPPDRAAEQFFGEPVYMHQFKINAKAPFDGVWQWHQNYGNQNNDMTPEATQ